MANRCAQALEDKCTSLLAKHIENSRSLCLGSPTYRHSLKYLLLNDRIISVEINDPCEFEAFEFHGGMIAANGPALSEARVSDFVLGARRVKAQYEAVLKMKKSGVNSAWLLVSAYYCAFFASLEISKLFNRISLSLDSDDIDALRAKATGERHADFFTAGASNFVGYERAGKLIFKSIGTKPHVAAWENCRHVLKQVLSHRDWPEAKRYLCILTDDKYSPSRIRNLWNYKRSDYYGDAGEHMGDSFKKLIGNPIGSSHWIMGKTTRIDELDPCIIPVLCEPLTAAVVESAKRAISLARAAEK